MNENLQVLIIGAGVMGCSLAFELARLGARVTVLERGAVCSGSSGLNSGGVRHQFTNRLNVQLASRTIERLGTFPDEFGLDIGFKQVGYMFMVSTSEHEAIFRDAVAQQRGLGIASTFIDLGEIEHLVPGINTAGLRGAAFCATDGYVDPYAVVTGYAASARRLGASFLLGDAVVRARRTDSRLASVTTRSGRTYHADVFVNAAGVWSTAVAALWDDVLPIQPWRSQAFIIGGIPDLGDDVPMVIDFDNGKLYFHREGPGLLCGMDNEHASPLADSTPCDWAKFPQLAERLTFRLPMLEAAVALRGWAGFMELTPDDNPIVGWSGLDNVYVSAGFSGHGMSIAPGLAVEVAREICGLLGALDLEAYRPSRFGANAGEQEAFSMR
jgi:sarcosine oxidase subunit beta